MRKLRIALAFAFILLSNFSVSLVRAMPAAVTYYVSSSTGNDNNNGLTQNSPFASVGKVNSLNLQPGDQVLFKCGDAWRADPLILSKSGTESAQIVFSSYPAGCSNKPLLSGSRPIGGWVLDSGNIYRADLSSIDFPMGINQLFRSSQRLILGRWPNADAPNGGYAFVDAHTAGSGQFTDNALPAANWNGAIIHIKNIRWSMLDRQVTNTNGHTLTLNQGLSCLISSWGSCTDWGYFINNSRNTLDQDGEWYYDSNARRVYLVSTAGAPANIEGSVVLDQIDGTRSSGLMLSNGAATAFVIIDNFEIKNWFNDGIGTPGGMNGDIYHHLTVRNTIVKDVNGVGINLSGWLERPSDGRKGLRGGHDLVFTNNTIDGANSFGISGYFSTTTFEGNTIRNIALVQNLGKSGMGCGLTSNECTENGDGLRIRLYDVQDSGFGNTLRANTFEKIGYNGVDVFGPNTILENNFITQACFTKADCGGVRVFGDTSIATTTVYNVHLINNIIVDIPGNVDGCHPSRAPFGMGLYIDNYSRDVETRGNTVINTTISGILYQQSTGQIIGNTIYNASSGTEFSGQIDLGGSATRVTMTSNILYAINSNAWTLYASSVNNVTSSDYNYFFHPFVNQHIAYGPFWTRQTFAQWQALSKQDSHSKTNWFTQPAGQTSRAKVFYNATFQNQAFDLSDRQYLDLDQAPVSNNLSLAPFSSKILIDNGPAVLTLKGTSPSLLSASEATDFYLVAVGTGFTANSIVRWNGSNRPTSFVSSSRLSAAIPASDVNKTGNYLITVYDPLVVPGGKETPPLIFKVVDIIYKIHIPLARR